MTRGFHWFVAWRYLMSRPRGVSPAIIAVAGLAFIVSAVLAGIASGVLERAADTGFTSLWAYRNGFSAAIGVFGLGAIAILYSMVCHAMRSPERPMVPFAFVLSLMLVAGGAVAVGAADSTTRSVALGLLGAGGILFLVAVVLCLVSHPDRTVGPLVFAVLTSGAGAAAISIAESGLRPVTAMALTYHADVMVLPRVGLLALGIGSAVVGLIGYFGTRRVGRATTGVAAFFIAASAAYPLLARAIFSEERWVQYDPTGAEFAQRIHYAGLALTGAGALLAVFLGIEYLGRRRRNRLRLLGLQLSFAAMVVGGLALAAARLLFSPPDFMLVAPVGGPALGQGPLLAAVAVLALGELAVVLAMIRYLFTFFTTVSVAGVAIGSMALVIVLSVMGGFETDLRNKILGSNAHVLITKDEGSFTEYRELSAKIEKLPRVVATTPYLTSEVVIAANNNYSNVIIKGVDPATVGQVTELDENSEDPQALQRLWPLAEDGGTLGPPGDAGPGDDGGLRDAGPDDAGSPGDAGPPADAGVGDPVDPPPPDFDVDVDQPTDFSGGDDAVPSDFARDVGEPADFSGDGDEVGDAAIAAGDDDARDIDEPPVPDDDDGDAGTDEGVPGDDGDVAVDEGADGDAGVVIEPFDPDLQGGIFDLDDAPIQQRIPPRIARLPGVLVGRELVKQIHLYVGQEVRVVSPLAEDTPAGPVPRTRFLRVADIFFSGMYEYDFKFVYVPLPVLQSFLDLEDEVTGIEVRIDDPDETGPLVRAMRQRLPSGYRVQDWKEINRSLFSALKLEKIAMFLVLAIIILVASFSIVGNLIMVVVEKAKEIALLKTLGASNGGIMKVFVAQGFFIGLVGTAIGLIHGVIACILGSTYGLPLNPEVYYIDQLPIHIESDSLVAIAVAGVAISVIATLYPAWVGARLRPIEGLRYE